VGEEVGEEDRENNNAPITMSLAAKRILPKEGCNDSFGMRRSASKGV
jgi:hypothetical protein